MAQWIKVEDDILTVAPAGSTESAVLVEWGNGIKKAEKDRIIKLLEDNKIPCDCGDTCGYFDAGYAEAIALIKGEKE